jgi:phosphatidylglycerophosphatase A
VSALTPRPPEPRTRKMRVAYTLATWFGCGYVPYVPGTVGTFAALPLYFVLSGAGWIAVLAGAVVVAAVGVWAAEMVVKDTQKKDPQIVVIDEVAGVLFTLAAAPRTLAAVSIGVLAFRVLDQWKPWPARWAEKKLPGGWGVVVDDVFAGAWGALVMLTWRAWTVD